MTGLNLFHAIAKEGEWGWLTSRLSDKSYVVVIKYVHVAEGHSIVTSFCFQFEYLVIQFYK